MHTCISLSLYIYIYLHTHYTLRPAAVLAGVGPCLLPAAARLLGAAGEGPTCIHMYIYIYILYAIRYIIYYYNHITWSQ